MSSDKYQNNNTRVTFSRLEADLLLLHPPAFFDFRERKDIYFPFLGTSGDVPITPLYEYFPLGFKTLQRYLCERGYTVKIINLSTFLLRYPNINIDDLIEAFDVKLIGIDLHWMVHVQGSLEIAKLIKGIHKETPIIFGGISSTYYANELINYTFQDMVMLGHDTHIPTAILLKNIIQRKGLNQVPNLIWKDRSGQIRENGFTYKPNTFGCGVDWRNIPNNEINNALPILELLSTQNAGCSYNCGWCGGSRDSFKRIFKTKKALSRKPPTEIQYEFDNIKGLEQADRYHLYSVGSYNETNSSMYSLLALIGDANLKSVSYEQYYLTPDDVLRRMAEVNNRTTITLSPESHDIRVSKLAGRRVYTNEELEVWLTKAFDYGIFQIDIWYFIGMPEQDEKSVMETVDYCIRLINKYQGMRVNPMICPMIPFLDPASTFFEYPDKHGYRIFFRTAEEHRKGMEHASIINRINYETNWLTRSELVNIGYKAIKRLMQAKADFGLFPKSWIKNYNNKIDDALAFIDIVNEVDNIENEKQRKLELDRLGDEILRRNNDIFFLGVSNQAYPINRQIGGRWFDELGWEKTELDAICSRN